jgi:hypothetical protein
MSRSVGRKSACDQSGRLFLRSSLKIAPRPLSVAHALSVWIGAASSGVLSALPVEAARELAWPGDVALQAWASASILSEPVTHPPSKVVTRRIEPKLVVDLVRADLSAVGPREGASRGLSLERAGERVCALTYPRPRDVACPTNRCESKPRGELARCIARAANPLPLHLARRAHSALAWGGALRFRQGQLMMPIPGRATESGR